MRCPTCNAPLQDDAEVCTFCGTVTEHGRKARAERAVRQEAEQRESARKAELQASAARARDLQEARASANRSLMWSLLGMVACCLPLGPIIGVVMARRARELALQHKVPTTHATVALAVAIGTIVFTLACWAGVAVVIKQESDRKDALRAAIGKTDTDAELAAPTACAMAELELLNRSYEGYSHLNDAFVCSAKLVREGEGAQLVGSAITKSGGKELPVVACFAYAQGRWRITQLRPDARCDQPPPDDGAKQR